MAWINDDNNNNNKKRIQTQMPHKVFLQKFIEEFALKRLRKQPSQHPPCLISGTTITNVQNMRKTKLFHNPPSLYCKLLSHTRFTWFCPQLRPAWRNSKHGPVQVTLQLRKPYTHHGWKSPGILESWYLCVFIKNKIFCIINMNESHCSLTWGQVCRVPIQ